VARALGGDEELDRKFAMQSKGMAYRAEIDGLRALAVLPVIFYHADISGFSGGFVGVDVFFVISGYLITSIILTEYQAGTFSFVGFYERRARRILPPLALVCFAAIPFAVLILGPHDLVDFSKSLLAVAAFASNFFFWSQSGYFDTGADLKPLLHTWSLAVEEQFYLLFPIFLFTSLKLGRRFAVAACLIVGALSFWYAQWGSIHTPESVFYLLPARMWELLIGALVPIAAIELDGLCSDTICELLSAAGLASIAVAVFTYQQVPYPGVFALPPVVGTLLIILFATQRTFVGGVLGSSPLRGIGLISYSAYLWHQPLFVFARLSRFYNPDPLVFVALSVVALLLATLTYFLVERPVRNRSRVSRRSIFTLSAVGTAGLAIFGVIGIESKGLESLYLDRNDVASQQAYQLIKKYAFRDLDADMFDNGDCIFWSKVIDAAFEVRMRSCTKKYGSATVVIGDSHAMNVYNALAAASIGDFVVGLVSPGCRPWGGCQYFSEFSELIKRNRSMIRGVVFNVSGAHLLTDLTGNDENRHLFDPGVRYLIDTAHIKTTAQYLQTLGSLIPVIWLGPFVEARVDFRNLPQLTKDGFQMNPVSLDHFRALDSEIARETSGLHQFSYLPIYDVFKIDSHFLVTGDCLTFSDFDHLSTCGEKLLGARLRLFLPWAPAG
jgi:peptidoglycan/LPS O-acetylase OafA/YrhL